MLLLGDLNSRSPQFSDIVKTDSFICDVYGNQDLYRENMEIIKCFNDCNLSLSHKYDDKATNLIMFTCTYLCIVKSCDIKYV